MTEEGQSERISELEKDVLGLKANANELKHGNINRYNELVRHKNNTMYVYISIMYILIIIGILYIFATQLDITGRDEQGYLIIEYPMNEVLFVASACCVCIIVAIVWIYTCMILTIEERD
jgi:hypothetical protein